MGHNFGERSTMFLKTLHPDLQRVLRASIRRIDFSIICGFRGETEQNKAFAGGFSHLKWPESTHNRVPSDGVDVAPHPLDWSNVVRFCKVAAVIINEAGKMGIILRWGGAWGDWGHLERVEPPAPPAVPD